MNALQSDFAWFELTTLGLSVNFVSLDQRMLTPRDYWSTLAETCPDTADRRFTFFAPLDTLFLGRGRSEFCAKAKLAIEFVFASDASDPTTPEKLYAALISRRHEFPSSIDPSDSPSALSSTEDFVETALHRICSA